MPCENCTEIIYPTYIDNTISTTHSISFNDTTDTLTSIVNGITATTIIPNVSGVTSINGLTAMTQTFTNGSTGTTPLFVSSGTVHTLNIPLASASGVTNGLISNTDFNTFNNKQDLLVSGTNIKTINGQPILGSGNLAISSSGTGITDGDKGDITVSGSGANWQINTASVANTDLANMATKTYKGRTSATTGVPEDVPIATLKTDLNLVKADVGLANVDNTSDANKPVSTATTTALGLKQNTITVSLNGTTVNTNPSVLNFAGAGVTVSETPTGTSLITIAGGSGSVTTGNLLGDNTATVATGTARLVGGNATITVPLKFGTAGTAVTAPATTGGYQLQSTDNSVVITNPTAGVLNFAVPSSSTDYYNANTATTGNVTANRATQSAFTHYTVPFTTNRIHILSTTGAVNGDSITVSVGYAGTDILPGTNQLEIRNATAGGTLIETFTDGLGIEGHYKFNGTAWVKVR